MDTFIVGYMNLFDNDLILECVEADTTNEAIWKHSKLQGEDWDACKPPTDTMSTENVKQFFFDLDTVVGVIGIPGLVNR